MEEIFITLEGKTFSSSISLDVDLKRNEYSFTSPHQEMLKVKGKLNDLRELQAQIQVLTDAYIYLLKLNPQPF